MHLVYGLSGGPSAAITVTAGEPQARLLPISWTSAGSGVEYHIFLTNVSTDETTYIDSTTLLAYDVPCEPETEYRVEVYALEGIGSVVVTSAASTVNPNTAYRFLGDTMSYTGSGGASVQSLRSGILNTDDHPIVEAAAILASTADPPAVPTSITYFGGGATIVDSTIPTPADGGGTISGDNQPTPTLAFSDSKTIGTGVAAGGILYVQTALPGAGVLPFASRSLQVGSSGAIHPSAYAAGARDAYDPAAQPGVFYTSFIEAGIYSGPVNLVVKLGPKSGTPASICNVLVIGDSTAAQQLPGAVDNIEGWMYQANGQLVTAESKVRFANFAQGNAKLSDIEHRLNRILSYQPIYSRTQIALRQVATANQEFVDVADAQAYWTIFLAQKATLEAATGVVVLPLMMTPAPGFFQSAGNLAAYEWLKTATSDMDGLRLDNVITNDNMLLDGAHVNSAGQALQATAAASRMPGIALRHGMEV
jgi:hypothetical protein